MNRYNSVSKIFASVAVLLLVSSGALSETTGTYSGDDIDRLLSRAKSRFDFEEQDAVLLLESRSAEILASGDLITSVHTVVWINTSTAIRAYADLRVPYNLSNSRMKVLRLRTWRDGRWWPDESEISPTAVVETVPFALALADDYSTMRETMLLHDGIELPCIMETEYEITVEGGAKDGYDELFIFARSDPALEVEYSVTVPSGTKVHFDSGNGIGEPEVTRGGADRYLWRAANLERLGTPRTDDPAGYAPYLAWSTWKSWDQLAAKIFFSFDAAAGSGEGMADTVAARTEYEPSPLSVARKTAELVNEFTRCVHYSSRFWRFSPRQAPRIYDTAYGHPLDRAVLAAALFRSAGLDASPVFRSRGPAAFDTAVPGLSRFGDMLLLVGEGADLLLYDPQADELTDGLSALRGYTVFRPGTEGNDPYRYHGAEEGESGRFELVMTVNASGEERITGKGYFRAENILSPYSEMSGLDGQSLSHIGRLAGSVLAGADPGTYNFDSFTSSMVEAGFDFEAPVPQKDGLGRTTIIAGSPAGGIIDVIPHGIVLFSSDRKSPVFFRSKMSQKVSFVIDPGKKETVYVPSERSIENTVGNFSVKVRNKDGRIFVDRELSIGTPVVPAEMWPELRALLLEETDAANGTVILR